MAHTPGPWHVGLYRASKAFRSIEVHIAVLRHNKHLLAISGPAGNVQAKEDAALMAAAPDLLEACEAVLGMCMAPEAFSFARAERILRSAIVRARAELQ